MLEFLPLIAGLGGLLYVVNKGEEEDTKEFHEEMAWNYA